jgi:hypothetical protein
MLRTKMRKTSRRSLAITGAIFTAGFLVIVAGLCWSFLDRNAFFSESIRAKRCRADLARVAAGKASYASFHGLTNGAPVLAEDIVEFVQGGWDALTCPSGEPVAVGAIGGPVTCPKHGMLP